MPGKKPSLPKRGHESTSPRTVPLDSLPDVALAAVSSSRKQKEVGDFITFLLEALEHNSNWVNDIVGRQINFRCALMVGAGPNRFQLQEIIYPSEDKDVKFEVELKESEDYDKIAIAALVKLTNSDMNYLLEYIKNRLYDNSKLKQDLLKGKALGISFAVLRPLSEKQYRVMERIVLGGSMKCVVSNKRKREDKSLVKTPIKKARRVA